MSIVEDLDAVANHLEARGLVRLAAMLDVVSNELENREAATETVGVNDFVKRQLQRAHWTHIPSDATMEKVRKATERALNKGEAKPGYMEGVKIVTLTTQEFPEIKSTIAQISEESKQHLQTKTTRRPRTDGVQEDTYETQYFPHGSTEPLPAHHIDVVLYSKAQLESENAGVTGADWDIISINSEPYEKSAPMALTTMLRNESGAGGSGHKHTDEEKEESRKFWSQHAQVGEPPEPR